MSVSQVRGQSDRCLKSPAVNVTGVGRFSIPNYKLIILEQKFEQLCCAISCNNTDEYKVKVQICAQEV